MDIIPALFFLAAAIMQGANVAATRARRKGN